MNRQEKIALVVIFISSLLVLSLGIYFGQYNLSYKVTTNTSLTYLGNNTYASGIINLTYPDQLSVISNVTPYLIPYDSNLSYNSQINGISKDSINATNNIDDIYIYPSLQGEFLIIVFSHGMPRFSYTITSPTVFSTLSVVLIMIGIALIISGVTFVYFIIIKGLE